jgi:hypothetical protein
VTSGADVPSGIAVGGTPSSSMSSTGYSPGQSPRVAYLGDADRTVHRPEVRAGKGLRRLLGSCPSSHRSVVIMFVAVGSLVARLNSEIT